MKNLTNENELVQKLTNYSHKIIKYVEESKKSNQPNKKIFRKKKVRHFAYLNHHMRINTLDPLDIEKDDWTQHAWVVIRVIKELPETKELEKSLTESFQNYRKGLLSNYVQKLVHLSVQNKVSGFYSIRNLVKYFLKEIKNEPLKVILKHELAGIALQSNSIKIASGITLRRIKNRIWNVRFL